LTWDLSEPYGLWAGLIGGIFVTLGSHGVDQMMVQRYLCAPRLIDARKALCVGGFVIVAQFALFLLIGVGLFVFYQTFPPEVAFERPDRVFARFILDEMPVGLVGLLLGAVFAAAMSTLSSSLNSCATSATHDLYVPLMGERATPEAQLRMTRTLTAVFGVLQIAVGIGGQYLRDSVVNSIFSIAGFTTGIVLGVFFLGMYAPKVGQRAALAGLVVGLVGMTAVFFATSLAWPWFALVGSVGTFAVGILASWIWPQPVRVS
jgi:Na+/proline symporter